MKRAYTLAAALLTATLALAQTRSEEQTRQIAAERLGATVALLKTTDTYNIYARAEGHGFAIVSKRPGTQEVLAYADGDFPQEEDTPCGLRWWLKATEARLRQADGQAQPPTATRGRREATSVLVQNFVNSQWGQSEPYNGRCPALTGGQQPPTGCVATAMAQVMYYYKYPAQGQGRNYYTINGSTYNHWVYVNHSYDWANMRNVYSSSSKQEVKDAVATLMYDCGVASRMDYAANGSGAHEYVAALGFARHFQYDSLSLRCLFRELYSQADWMKAIRQEMTAKRPILYCGYDPETGGHAFVFSGLDANDRVYVNWGWNGWGNGFFSIDALNPSVPSEPQGNGKFNHEQSMILGFKPQATPDAYERLHSMWVTAATLDKAVIEGDIFQLSARQEFMQYHYLPFKGVIGLMLVDDETEEWTLSPSKTYTRDVDFGNGTRDNFVVGLSTLKPGTYRAYLASQARGEEEPTPMLNYQTLEEPWIYLVKTADGRYAMSHDYITSVGALAGESAAGPTRVYDAAGRLVYRQASGRLRVADIPGRGLFVVQYGGTTRKVFK